jgi:Fe-S cluster assembly iron-binding protein IscA
MLALTTDATTAIEQILAAPGMPDSAGLRIAEAPSGDHQSASGDLQVLLSDQPLAGDEVIEDRGARVFIEETVTTYLDDKQLDAEIIDKQVRFSLAESVV